MVAGSKAIGEAGQGAMIFQLVLRLLVSTSLSLMYTMVNGL